MKKTVRTYLVLILTFLSASSLSFAEVTVPSQIARVVLFSDQALVTREAAAAVHKGLTDLFLELEAFSVDKDSVSARVFGEGEIFSVQFKEIYLKEPAQENIRALEQRIRELTESKRTLSDEKEVLTKQESFLRSVVDFSQTQVPQEIKTNFPKTEDLGKTLAFLASSFQSIHEKKQSLDIRMEKLDTEIRVLEKELESLKRRGGPGKRVIEVLFNSAKEQKIRIEANYVVRNAFWTPFYKASVPLTLDEVDLTMFSKIQQTTGEDWKGVALSVSNVIPLKGVELPSPASWLLDIERPQEKAMGAARILSMQKRAEAPADAMAEAGAYEPEAAMAGAERIELPLSFEYRIPQALDIESQDKETLLPLFTKTLSGEFFYYAVPRVNALTFLVCKARADKELLSGPLQVHFGGRFVGKTFLAEKKAGEEFHLNLGADREVKVKRERIRDKTKETFFGKVERDMAFKISLENLKDKPITIKVLDSIPVSRTDKVEVKNVKITPAPTEKNYEDREGVFLWGLELKPGAKQEIAIEFVISYPKDQPVAGL